MVYFFRTIFVILYNTIIFFVFGRFNLISCIKRPKQCELIRTLEGKKGAKYVFKNCFTIIYCSYILFRQKCSLVKDQKFLQPRKKKDPQSKVKKRFLNKGLKYLPQSRNLYMKEFLGQETFL